MPSNAAFNPTILSGQLLRKLRMSLVFNSIVSRDFEGEINGPEDSVKILAPLAVSVEDADGSKMSYGDQLLAEDAVLSMAHKKRFGFLAKDIDNASAAADVFADETFQEVLKAAQRYVLAQYTEADNANQITVAVGDDMGTRLRDASETLDEQEAPEMGRFVVLPPSAVREIEDELSDKGTQLGDAVTQTGFAGMYAGLQIFKAPSSHFTTTGTSPQYLHAMYGYRGAITYADAIVNVESGRHSDFIADYVRGIHVAGAKVLPRRAKVLGDFRIEQA